MPYGTISTVTHDWLVARAARDGVTEDKLGLEPDFDFEGEDVIPDNLYEVAIIFGGALDETFYVQTDYEVNIADWLAEQCSEEAAKQDGEDWVISVSFVIYDGPDIAARDAKYTVTSDSYGG